MMLTEKDILHFENHIEIKILEKFGIKIIGTKKKYGCIKKKEANEILKDFNIKDKILFSGYQTHSDNIQVIDNLSKTFFENTDGLLSSNKKAALLVKYADCLPIFIYDEKTDFFGAVHSGWEGSYKTIILKAISKIPNIDLNSINIVFGVGISCKNYEVQEDFYLKFKEKFSAEIIKASFKKDGDKYFFDNQLFNFLLLKDFGIPENKIFMNQLCTFENNTFHSYRRDKDKSGRNGAIIYKI
ncbi:peptidoglycan editing factor PgeF [Fusobacterium russii]|uniref:peptidoglycan editing factor PgeF n=1 Tax=Fusobacterium russii TaxID=854 RepID=UPI0003A42230|nr:peptidoglycan editing factor PgeF [Fusobacterium russii]